MAPISAGPDMQDPNLLVDGIRSGRPDVGDPVIMDEDSLTATRLACNLEVLYQEWGPFWRLSGRVRAHTLYGATFVWKTLQVGMSFSRGARLHSAKHCCIDHGIFQPDPIKAA